MGRKVAAFREDAGDVNEKHLSVIRRGNGDLVGVRQIAGLLARRVVCYLKEGDRVHRGQPMGLIKFSSRVDLLVPEGYRMLVKKGDRLKNGATPVAAPRPARTARDGRAGGAPKRRGMRRGAYLLPSLFTMGNMVLGFYAIILGLHGPLPAGAP